MSSDIKGTIRMKKIKFLLILISFLNNAAFAQNDFFNQRYRGWLWFEEKEKFDDKIYENKKQSDEFIKKEMLRAKAKNEQFKEELELLGHLIIRHPENLEYIRKYREKEKIMFKNAGLLSKNMVMTDFLNPNITNELENPQNFYGRRAFKEDEEHKHQKIIKSLSSKVEIFLFIKADCNHCETLEKHLARFVNLYGFHVEAVSIDGVKSKYFKTYTSKELIEQLDLKEMPTVIAVTNDSKMRFELARGAVSVSNLEDATVMMGKFLAENSVNESGTLTNN